MVFEAAAEKKATRDNASTDQPDEAPKPENGPVCPRLVWPGEYIAKNRGRLCLECRRIILSFGLPFLAGQAGKCAMLVFWFFGRWQG
jgi:hypothetical protein